jgi:hypothetical protein
MPPTVLLLASSAFTVRFDPSALGAPATRTLHVLSDDAADPGL